MPALFLWMVVGFALVTGTMTVVRWTRHRAITSVDDPSILLAAPPEGLTPAVAAHLDGAPARLAFMAALLDLASRGEIAFVPEGMTKGVADVGILVGGADPADARIERNRRQPAGEAEAWLLGQLVLAAGHRAHAPWDSNVLLDGTLPFLVDAGAAMVQAVQRQAGVRPEDQMGATATAQRERGLLEADPATDAREAAGPAATASAVATGPMVATTVTGIATAGSPAAAGAATPAAAGAATPAAGSATAALAAEAPVSIAGPPAPGSPPTPASPPGADSDAAAAGGAGSAASSRRLWISASSARGLAMPVLFGTFLETYARRHGWLGSLPIVTRIRWRIGAIVAAAAGIVLISAGVDGYSDAQTGLGVGLLFGGMAGYWMAPMMVQPSAAGGRVRAQAAAWRRTLQMTFRSASTISDAVGPGGLVWLTTPDQAIAWAVALGLGSDVWTLLARSTPASAAAGEAPAWYRSVHRRGVSGTDPALAAISPAAMFAGIGAIGSRAVVLPRFLRPMLGFWPL